MEREGLSENDRTARSGVQVAVSCVIGIVFFVYSNHRTPPLHAALAPTQQRVETECIIPIINLKEG